MRNTLLTATLLVLVALWGFGCGSDQQTTDDEPGSPPPSQEQPGSPPPDEPGS